MRWWISCSVVWLVAGCSEDARPVGRPGAMGEQRAPRAPAPVRRTDTEPATDTQVSLRVLAESVRSEDYSVRLLAVDAIGDLDDALALSWLNEALGDPEHDVRLAAVEALGRRLSTARAALLRTVRDDTKEELDIRALAASALLRRREVCR